MNFVVLDIELVAYTSLSPHFNVDERCYVSRWHIEERVNIQ